MLKIIMFQGGVETLTYFSQQIAQYFLQKADAVFWYDLENSETSAKRVKRFIRPGKTVVVTFNFLGLSAETGCFDEKRGYLWEQYDVPCINIIVDHPLYYTERFSLLPKRCYHVLIDRKHLQYMRDYFTEYPVLGFMPLAGTALEPEPSFLPRIWQNRPVSVLFVGNYNDPRQYEPYITRIDKEYEMFYRGIINELLNHPQRTLEEVVKRHGIREMGMLSKEEWKVCFQHMNFIDLYLRFTMRERVVCTLAEAGIPIDIWGRGWENCPCRQKQNLILHGGTDSRRCLLEMQQAKISLNVMPWFKDGAHDRVFNAMLNGSLSVTDDSIYMQEQFQNEENIIFYSLTSTAEDGIQTLAERIRQLLNEPQKMAGICENAYRKCKGLHTWKQRAEVLDTMIQNIIS